MESFISGFWSDIMSLKAIEALQYNAVHSTKCVGTIGVHDFCYSKSYTMSLNAMKHVTDSIQLVLKLVMSLEPS